MFYCNVEASTSNFCCPKVYTDSKNILSTFQNLSSPKRVILCGTKGKQKYIFKRKKKRLYYESTSEGEITDGFVHRIDEYENDDESELFSKR